MSSSECAASRPLTKRRSLSWLVRATVERVYNHPGDLMSTSSRLGDVTTSEQVVVDSCEAWKAIDLDAAWREYLDLDQHAND